MDRDLVLLGLVLASVGGLATAAQNVPIIGQLAGLALVLVALIEAHHLMKKGLKFQMNVKGIAYLFLFAGFAIVGISGAMQFFGMANFLAGVSGSGLGALAAIMGLL